MAPRRWAVACVVVALGLWGCDLPLPDDPQNDPGPPTTSGAQQGKGKGNGKGKGKGKKKDDSPSDAPDPSSSSSAAPSGTAVAPPVSGSIHLALGTPAEAKPGDDHLLIKPQYVVGYSKSRNVPNWVSWELNASYFGDAPRHKGKFLPDTTLPDGLFRAQDHDYSGSGFDRGHMVRSEERTRSPEDNTSTFYLTNILPQTHDLNAGPWLRLEEYAQDLSQKENKELFIVAGGLFDSKPATIGKGLAVPESCFKVIVVLNRGQGLSDVTAKTRVITVIMPNVKGIMMEPWGGYRTRLSDVEKRSRHTFLTAVPEPIRKTLAEVVDSGPTSSSR